MTHTTEQYFPSNNKTVRTILILCIAALLTASLSFLSGCVPSGDPFIEGTYITNKDRDNSTISDIPEIMLRLTEIDEETFKNADGQNVIEEYRSSEEIRYFSFELFLYAEELGDYQQIDTTGFYRQKGAPQTYYGDIDESQKAFGISGFTFNYNTPINIVIFREGNEYIYYLSLQNS